MAGMGGGVASKLFGDGVKNVTIKLWGAGGGADNGDAEPGGSGGYVEVSSTLLSAGTTLYVYVGQKGSNAANGGDYTTRFGGGGRAGNPSFGGASGGGASYVYKDNVQGVGTLLSVSGGGGGNAYSGGGNGGGSTADAGLTYQTAGGGGGGTQSAGGAGGAGGNGGGAGNPGSFLQGGNGGTVNPPAGCGGGGGGGYYGGGGGGGNGSGHSGGGAGGGSSYVNTSFLTSIQNLKNASRGVANNTSDPDYSPSINFGGSHTGPGEGGHGRVVIIINGAKTTFDYTGSVQSITI